MGGAVRILDAAMAPNASDGVSIDSALAGPIESHSFLRQSLLMAELAEICYLPRALAGRLACQIGLPEIRFYNRDGAQAYIFANDQDAVVVCRGTEPHDWNDIRADLTLGLAISETVGRVHRGFKQEVDDLWPRLERVLASNGRTLWFAGHSLGAAMAAICAGRCQLSHSVANPHALFTFGCPRIGNRRYVNHVGLKAYRWVNNNDIVPRVPPRWLGYRHKGRQIYLDAAGQVRDFTVWQRFKDRWRGFAQALRNREFDHFADHAIRRYVEAIQRAVEQEEATVKFRQRQEWPASAPPLRAAA